MRNGLDPKGGIITGTVFAGSKAPANTIGSAFVEACPAAGVCRTTVTDAGGQFRFAGLTPGTYTLRGLPPSGTTTLGTAKAGPISVVALTTSAGNDLVLPAPHGPPPGTTITSIGTGTSGLPTIYWGDPLTLTTTGCANGQATFTMTLNGVVVRSGTLTQTSPGVYTNPDATDAQGHFGWDVVSGYYRVRAQAAGCHSPQNPAVAFAETPTLTIPPPTTDLDIRLDCTIPAPPPAPVQQQAVGRPAAKKTACASLTSTKLRSCRLSVALAKCRATKGAAHAACVKTARLHFRPRPASSPFTRFRTPTGNIVCAATRTRGPSPSNSPGRS